jgi:hypothetical protein
MRKAVSFAAAVLCLITLSAFVPKAVRAQTHTVHLTWTAGVPVSGSTVADASYNVYSAPGGCGAGLTFTKINSAPVTTPSFNDTSSYLTSTSSPQTFCYQVTAIAAPVPPATVGVEGAPSNQVAIVIPAIVLPPAPPVLATPTVSTP